MEISEFTFKILMLFTPGILCSLVVNTFCVTKEKTNFEFAIFSFLYGIFSYATYYLIYTSIPECLKTNGNTVHFITSLTKANSIVSFQEIIYTCLISVAIGLLITYINTNKLHFKLVRRLGITNKFSEFDVWGYLMNSPDVDWITVRDIKNNLMYDGWIQAFSDNSKEAELLLADVKVYNNETGDFLYEVDAQYLSLDRSNISIEVRTQS